MAQKDIMGIHGTSPHGKDLDYKIAMRLIRRSSGGVPHYLTSSSLGLQGCYVTNVFAIIIRKQSVFK